jgi:hypothetical protein
MLPLDTVKVLFLLLVSCLLQCCSVYFLYYFRKHNNRKYSLPNGAEGKAGFESIDRSDLI